MFSNFLETPDTFAILERIFTAKGVTKNARIKAIIGFLGNTGITVEKIHDPSYLPLIHSIHHYLLNSDLKNYIQHIIDHPQDIQLDPLIVEIFNGTYLFSDSIQRTKKSTQSKVDSTL